MKDLIHNPVFYYLLVPVLVALWPLAMHFKYLPEQDKALEKWKDEYSKSEDLIEQILTLDPDRLNADPNQGPVKFEYATEIHRVASQYGIRQTFRTAPGSGKGRRATVQLKEVKLLQCANFLSTLQMKWEGLQCRSLSLNKKRDTKDQWNMDISFIYFD